MRGVRKDLERCYVRIGGGKGEAGGRGRQWLGVRRGIGRWSTRRLGRDRIVFTDGKATQREEDEMRSGRWCRRGAKTGRPRRENRRARKEDKRVVGRVLGMGWANEKPGRLASRYKRVMYSRGTHKPQMLTVKENEVGGRLAG